MSPTQRPINHAGGARRPGRWAWSIAIIAALGLAAAAVPMACRKSDGAAGTDGPVFAVKRGPLIISVSETGTIRPRQREVIKSELEGSAAILFLIPEGTIVKQGELLVELDASRLKDLIVDEQIRLRNAEAALTRETENLAVVRNQTEADMAKAMLDAQFAVEDLRNYLEGQYPKDLNEAKSKITLAEEEAKRTAEKLAWSQRLFQEKYLSQTELDSDRLAKQRAELDRDLAVQSLNLLEKFTRKRKVDELQSNGEQTKMTVERVKRKATADIVQAEADVSAKTSERDRQWEKVTKLETQIAMAKMVASREGMVVYATSVQGDSHRWGSQEPLAEGQTVRERQDLIYLPTASSFNVDVKIYEGALDKVKVGHPVRIEIDAMPGKTYTGTVSRIAPLPDPSSYFSNPDLKVFATVIMLDEDDVSLRTGMTCRAEILVAQYDDAVYVPVQSVLRVNNVPTVYVAGGKQIEARPVELGLDNNKMVRIVSGLREGELVLMNPPLSAGSAPMVEKINGGNGKTLDTTTRPAGLNGGAGTDGSAVEGGGPTSRPSLRDMTDEERAARKKQFESLSPEEREKLKQQYMKKRGPGGDGGMPQPPGGQ